MGDAMRRLRLQGVDYIWITAALEPRDYFDRWSFFKDLDPWLVPVLSGDRWILFGLKAPPAAAK
jgi:hypothetical protein